MPDYYSNILEIKGNYDKNIIKDNFSFQDLIPIEDFTKRQICKENWSCTKDAFNVNLTKTNNTTYIKFETENSPPEKWFKKLIEIYPEYNIKLYWMDIYDTPLCGKYTKNKNTIFLHENKYAKIFTKKYFNQ